ncbi:MAG TPA: winged helix DNA-binding domain-containing protein [Gemmatimonadaceae bacterium]|nr:winged helix DNA-binding domain-containing protein [Gemmatimonadaceae bacterium]
MTQIQIVRERMANQFLTTPGFAKASEVVRAMGAVQAQDYSGAKWALSQRANGAPDDVIEREISAGRILRIHVLRPTWHFVAPEDIRWMLALTGPRVISAMASYNRRLELTPAVFRRANGALTDALRGGNHFTRAELGEVLSGARLGKMTGQRLGHVMMQAELEAVVCSGARRGNQFTYALLDERAPPAAALDRDEALLELTRRYFTARGPATPHDFSWWSGLTVGDARRGIDIAGAVLQQLSLDGHTYWFKPRARSAPRESPTAHLLPNYDEYFIGFRNRSAIGQRLGHQRPVTGGSALIAHIVFVDGQIVGGWKRVVQGGNVAIVLSLLLPVTRSEFARIAAAARRFGEFLGMPVDLQRGQ